MANSEATSGVHSYVLFGEQTAFGTEQTTVNKHLGLLKSFTPRANNTNTYFRGYRGTTDGGRNVRKYTGGLIETGFSVEFDILNWAFFEHLIGTRSGSDPYTYTEADLLKYYTFHRSIDNPGSAATDQDLIFLDCVANSATIRTALNESVSASVEYRGSSSKVDTTIPSAVALPSEDVYNFTGATIELPNGTLISNIIDSVEFSFNNNVEFAGGLGSRFVQSMRPGARDYKINITFKYLDNDFIEKVLGALAPTSTTQPTNNATLELNFASSTRSMALLFSEFVLDDWTGTENVNEIMMEGVNGTAFSLSGTEDNT